MVGEHNVVVHAAAGAVVSLRTEPMPPPRRREPAAMAAPRPGPPLFGRDAQCARIATWLDEQLPVQVHGESGIGRTALLRRVAADRAAVRPVVFLNAAGLSHDDLVQEIFQAFYDVTEYRPPTDRLRRLLGSVAAMLVIDDFGGTSAELTALLDLVPSCDVLIGSIQRTLLADGQALHLRGLDDEAARSLVTRQLGRRLTTEERTALEGIRERARGNPRALVQLALAVRALQEAAEATDGAPAEAEPARITLDAGVAVLAPLLAARLDDPQRDALCALRLVFPYALPTDALRVASGPTRPGGPEAAGGAEDDTDLVRLDLLAASGLVEATARGWRLTAALGVAATGHVGQPPTAAELADRLVAWGRVAPPREAADATEALLVVLDGAVRDGRPGVAVALARAVAPRVALSLRWDAWAAVLGRGRQAAQAARAAGDEEYFRHEEAIRARLLAGLVAGTVFGAGGGATAAYLQGTHAGSAGGGAGAAGGPASSAPRSTARGLGHGAARKAAIMVVTVIVVTTGVAFALRGPARSSGLVAGPVTSPSSAPVRPSGQPTAPTPSLTSVTPVTSASPTGPGPGPVTDPGSADCDPDPNYYSFTDIATGTTSAAQELTLDPACTYDRRGFVLDGPDAAAFQVTWAPSCPAGTFTGDRCRITIAFRPTRLGSADAHVALPRRDGGTGVDDTLAGTTTSRTQTTTMTPVPCGPEPPAGVTFPPTPAGTPVTQPYTFVSLGCAGRSYDLTSLSVTAPFSVHRDASCPGTIPGDSATTCRLDITLDPPSAEDAVTGTLRIAGSDGVDRTITLRGSVSAPTLTPTPSLTPTSTPSNTSSPLGG